MAYVRIGDELAVERHGNEWVALDDEGVLGHLRWQPGEDAKVHPGTGVVIRLPSRGVLWVRHLIVGSDGVVKDVGGEVVPAP